MVDGELSHQQEREVLLHCEETNCWRKLALGYVEQQMLRRELPSLFEEKPGPQTNALETQVQTPSSLHRRTNPNLTNHGWGKWSLAAAIVLAVAVGYGAGWGLRKPDSSTIAFPNEIAINDLQPKDSTQESIPWIIQTPNGAELQQIEIPIASSESESSWDEILRPGYDKALLDEMRSQGLNLQFQRTLTPVRLKNGKKVVVPVDYIFEQPFQ